MRISDMAMIDPERKETIQRSSSASLGCHKSNVFPYSSQGGGNFIQGFPDFKSEINVHTSGYQEAGSPIMMMSPVPLNNDYVRIPYNQDFYPQAIFHHEKVQQNQWGYLENYCNTMTHDYTLPVGDGIQNVPFNMFAPTYSHGYQFQEFQYFVVIDFEATCDKEQIPQPQEIIEFPSVLVNSMTGQLEASFQTYVRPAYNQNLTDFCKELTGIQQIQVDRGVPLSEALLMHDKWLEDKGIKKTNFAIVTWSNWDCRVMLDSECRFKRIRKPPYFNRWINLKLPFHNVFGPARCNLKEAVQLAGLAWEGRAHCGLDDARNTARLLALLMRQGFRFSITNSLAWQSADHPTLLQAPPTGQPGPISPPPKHKHLLVPSPFHPHAGERHTYCFCGVMSSKCIVRKPGPKHGRLFFGCGKWTATRGALCSYFEWAS